MVVIRRVCHTGGALLFAAVAILLPLPVGGDTIAPELPIPSVRSFSGSPLLLEVVVEDPGRLLSGIRFSTETSSQEYYLPPELDRDPLILRVSPFFSSGVYELHVTVRGTDGREASNSLQLGFVDFVWGRDNMSFGNNAKFESVIGTFGEVLADWTDARFGEVPEADMVLLVDYMYSLFGSNTGRCYAFAGTEVRYWRWPELLPSYYDSAHDISAGVSRNQREMNYLQFDIVFDHFVAGPGSTQMQRAMNSGEIEEQARRIAAHIAANEPVLTGFAGPNLHHSMLVFGAIYDPAHMTVDLLVANNWKSDEKLNIHSRDAEIIRLYLAGDHIGPRIEWRYEEGLRNRDIDRMFMVNVQKQYEHDRDLFVALLAELRASFRREGMVRVVVEEAAGARLTDGERTSGQVGSRRSNALPDVWYERVGRAYRLAFPADAASDLVLEVSDDRGARVLAVFPGDATTGNAALIQTAVPPEEGARVIRRVALRPTRE